MLNICAEDFDAKKEATLPEQRGLFGVEEDARLSGYSPSTRPKHLRQIVEDK